jgi:hypothetical protein
MYKKILQIVHKPSGLLDLEEQLVFQKSAFNKLLKPFNPKKDDKIYFTKDVTIPFAKLKDFMISHKVKRTTDLISADIVVTSQDFIYSYGNYNWYYIEKVENLINQIENGNDIAKNLFNPIIETLKNSDITHFIIESNTYYRINNLGLDLDLNYDYHRLCILESDITVLDEISNKTLVSELSILKNINGNDAVEINEDLYDQLKELIKSSDDDNLIVAMEIMANCQYIKSLPYLLILFKHHGDYFYNSRTKNHINFKSLVKFMDIHNRSFMINVDSMVDLLIRYKQLTEENLNTIFDKIIDDYTVKEESSSGRYDIGSLHFSEIIIDNEHVTKILGKPYKYKIKRWQ